VHLVNGGSDITGSYLLLSAPLSTVIVEMSHPSRITLFVIFIEFGDVTCKEEETSKLV
jgi:hypothetical protein